MVVKAYIGSQIAHVSQIFTGLALLRQEKKITLSFEKDVEIARHAAIQRMVVDGRLLVFDLSDGFQIDERYYGQCALYFKRMLSPEMAALHPKTRPYGLNYSVYVVGDGLLRRSWIFGDRNLFLKNVLRRSLWLSSLLNINLSYSTAQVVHFEGTPTFRAKPRIIYFTRLWDPSRVKDEALKSQRESMNSLRRNLIRALRKEFGQQFTGGIFRTEFSVAYAPAETVSDNAALHKRVYLNNLRQSDIGIADYGLEMSVGFKMAEYVAMAKAIVTTPVNVLLPGDFVSGENYIAYSNTDECINHCARLLQNPKMILEMQRQNSAYYREYLRPDMLIWNCLNAK